MPKLTCYFISGSPPCWTVMLALEAKGLGYEAERLSNTKGDQRSETFRVLNPRGTVPVLTNGDIAVRETNAILAYLEALRPEPLLLGSSPDETAAIWEIVEEAESCLRTPIGNVTRPIFRGRGAEMSESIAETMETVRRELGALEERLGSRYWLVGQTLSAADLVVYPALQQLVRGATREGADALDLRVMPLAQHYPNIAAWAARVEAMPNADRAYPPHWW